MAHVLNITDGTTTITLADGTNCVLGEYTPKSNFNGEGDVTEQIKVTIQAATIADVRTYINNINRMFQQADFFTRFGQNQLSATGSPVYANFDPGTTGTVYRSMITQGRVLATQSSLDSGWAGNQVDVTIEWTRQAFWEGPETEIALATTYAGAAATGGKTVYNKDEIASANKCVLFIKANTITGDLPAPLKFKLTNGNAGQYIDEFFVGHNLCAGIDYSPSMTVEGELAGGSVASIYASGGALGYFNWTATVETLIATWTTGNFILGANNDLGNMKGNRMAMFVRFGTVGGLSYSDLYLRFKITDDASPQPVLWEGNLVLFPTGRQLAVIDFLRLPLFGTNFNSQDYRLQLWALRNAAGAHQFAVDYIYFMPISGDNGFMRFRYPSVTSMGLYDIGAYTYDPYNPTDIQTLPASGLLELFSIEGGPITLFPKVEQSISFLFHRADGTAPIAQTATIQAYFRPRISAL